MTGPGNTDAEREFWDEIDCALEAAGNPSTTKISRDAAEKFDEDVPESTLRDWIRYRRFPRTSDTLVVMMRVLGAEHQCDWEALHERAQTARARAAASTAASSSSGAAESRTPPVPTAPERPQPDNSNAEPPASGQAGATTQITTPPEATPPTPARARPRRTMWWAGGLAVAVTAATVVVVFTRPDGAAQGRDTASTAGAAVAPTGTSRRGVPCRRSDGQAAPPGSSSAQPGARPTAYAHGGAGRAELVREQLQFVLTDDRGDGCSTILTVTADGAEMGPWANSWGKTGNVKDGRTVPAKPIDAPWLAGTRQVDFRVCVGEVVDGEIIFRERDCGSWVTAHL